MESLDLTVVLGVIVAVLGATSTFFAVRHQKVILELKELAQVVEESLEDGKITKDEQKEMLRTPTLDEMMNMHDREQLRKPEKRI